MAEALGWLEIKTSIKAKGPNDDSDEGSGETYLFELAPGLGRSCPRWEAGGVGRAITTCENGRTGIPGFCFENLGVARLRMLQLPVHGWVGASGPVLPYLTKPVVPLAKPQQNLVWAPVV